MCTDLSLGRLRGISIAGAAGLLAASLLAGSAAAQGSAGKNDQAAETLRAQNGKGSKLPKDVQEFISRRDQCDHFRNEPAEDEQRQAEVAEAADKFCTGTDKDLARLKRTHAADKAVQDALSAYDPNIE